MVVVSSFRSLHSLVYALSQLAVSRNSDGQEKADTLDAVPPVRMNYFRIQGPSPSLRQSSALYSLDNNGTLTCGTDVVIQHRRLSTMTKPETQPIHVEPADEVI